MTMATGIMNWVSLTALVLVVSCGPSGNHQMLLYFWVCGGAILLLLVFKQRAMVIAEESPNAGIDSSRGDLDQGRHEPTANPAL